jgi:hypothetical protein
MFIILLDIHTSPYSLSSMNIYIYDRCGRGSKLISYTISAISNGRNFRANDVYFILLTAIIFALLRHTLYALQILSFSIKTKRKVHEKKKQCMTFFN